MQELQAAKNLVRAYYLALDSAGSDRIAEVLREYAADSYLWRGVHPFHELEGVDAVADFFWKPLRSALAPIQRRMDIFIGGKNEIDGSESIWINSTGHLIGLFDASWLSIPATRKLAFLRYSEFHRIENGKIAETAMFFDIPQLMIQAGLQPFPVQTAAQVVQPGPASHDGLLFDAGDPAEGEKTLGLINRMIADLGQWNSGLPIEAELARTWHHNMLWWGPTGIGSAYTIKRYAEQHSRPFRASFAERTPTRHVARFAEGHYGGFFGWPNFTARPSGGFMGMPGTQKAGEFRVIDIYRREGGKLAENWVFIDLLHFWNQQGVDILSRASSIIK